MDRSIFPFRSCRKLRSNSHGSSDPVAISATSVSGVRSGCSRSGSDPCGVFEGALRAGRNPPGSCSCVADAPRQGAQLLAREKADHPRSHRGDRFLDLHDNSSAICRIGRNRGRQRRSESGQCESMGRRDERSGPYDPWRRVDYRAGTVGAGASPPGQDGLPASPKNVTDFRKGSGFERRSPGRRTWGFALILRSLATNSQSCPQQSK